MNVDAAEVIKELLKKISDLTCDVAMRDVLLRAKSRILDEQTNQIEELKRKLESE